MLNMGVSGGRSAFRGHQNMQKVMNEVMLMGLLMLAATIKGHSQASSEPFYAYLVLVPVQS